MFYEIEEDKGTLKIRGKYAQKSAGELGVKEKAIENWIALNPNLLFPREQILVIGQSIAGQSMADVLALDSFGNLIIVEVKRDWSDRATVAQLLEYAAGYQGMTYEYLNQIAQGYKNWQKGELIEKFREFIERPDFPPEKIAEKQRVYIVAPDSDSGLKKIVEWLRRYNVPIEFIAFRLLADGEGTLRLLDVGEATQDIQEEFAKDEWAGHWIFNTNETYAQGAYQRMFDQSVIAIYGYENGGGNLEGAQKGNKVFAYVNRQGLRALGEIVDPTVKPGKGIFIDENGNPKPEEYHVSVKWNVILDKDKAISNSQSSNMGYSLPIRTVFGRLHRGKVAQKIEEEIFRRKS